MPRGVYDRSKVKATKYGASFTKNIEKECEWCGKKVYVNRRKKRAVCSDWECQAKEEKREYEVRYQSSRKKYERRRTRSKSE